MKVFKIISGVIGVIVLVYLGMCFAGPKKLEIERSANVDASQKSVYMQVADLTKWANWSPWSEADPSMEMAYGENTMGEGASYSWIGEESGEGSLTITEAIPHTSIKTNLDFGDQGKGNGYWMFEEENGSTKVTWGMTSDELPFLARGMMLFVNMEETFDLGLANLGREAAKNPVLEEDENYSTADINLDDYNIETKPFPATSYVGVREVVPFQDMDKFFSENFEAIMMSNLTLAEGGVPSGIYYEWNEEAGTADMAAVVPTNGQTESLDERMKAIEIAASNALVYDYFGNYDGSMDAHLAINKYIETNENVTFKGPVIEQYITDPMEEADTAKWQTRIIYLID